MVFRLGLPAAGKNAYPFNLQPLFRLAKPDHGNGIEQRKSRYRSPLIATRKIGVTIASLIPGKMWGEYGSPYTGRIVTQWTLHPSYR